MTDPIKGVLEFYSETGTEGGWWAFQDEKFMGLPVENPYYNCTRCGAVWSKDKGEPEPGPHFTYWRPHLYRLTGNTNAPVKVLDEETEIPPLADNEEIMWFYKGYDKPMRFPIEGEASDLDGQWMAAMNEQARLCYEQGHERWKTPEEMWPNGTWSYEGLHVLNDGDHLTIFDKDDSTKVTWDGDVQLTDLGLFTDHVFNMWIHQDPVGVERETWARWFMEHWPAEYTKGAKP